MAEKRLLAEREAINCDSERCQFRCQKFLDTLRQKARFSLQETKADSPLPHSKEIKVQAAGIYGLQLQLDGKDPTDIDSLTNFQNRFNEVSKPIANINQTINDAMTTFGDEDDIPYADIIKTILRFNIRKRRKRDK